MPDPRPLLQQVDQDIQTPNDEENDGLRANSADAADEGHADGKPFPQPGANSSLGAVAVAGATAGALAGPAAAVAAVQAVGFSSTGIVGGSWAASMMSATAVASGGGVPAGSAVAVMQSIGAVGALTPGLAAGAAVAGGVVVGSLGLAGYGAYRLWRRFHPAAPTGKPAADDERPPAPAPAPAPADGKGAAAAPPPSPHDSAPAAA
jgi:hypothetical protein